MNSPTSVFLLLILISSISFCAAQDNLLMPSQACSTWTTIKIDSATSKKTLTAKEEVIVSDDNGKTGLSIYSFLNTNGKVIIISIQAMGAGKCVDKGDKINILFDDGEILDLANTNDFNCDGSSTLYFGGGLGRRNELKILASKRIKTMRVWTRDDYMQKTFSSAQAIAFAETLKCLSASMK
jgi:hypothetical protein